MPHFDSPDRRHSISHSARGAEIEISGSRPQYTWSVRLSALRKERFVEMRVLDQLVVEFTPEEARDFAQALLKVSSE